MTEERHEHDLGLDHDLPILLSRRSALGVMATGVGAFALTACGSDESDGSTTTAAATESSSDAASIPEETPGPFPADGSNGPDVLTESGIVRSDITTSFGGMKGTAEGVPTSVELALLDIAGGGSPLSGAAVYLWHCSREGAYSLYDPSVTDQNYLRGVQVSDDDGKVRFDSIFPACYSGRWPHMHFEIYESADAATAGGTKLRTSQLAVPKDLCDEIYATAGYEQSVTNLAQVSLDSDLVFSDGYSSQLASWTGSADKGVALTLNVGV